MPYKDPERKRQWEREHRQARNATYVAQRFMWRSLLGVPEDVPARANKRHIT